jgi:hypothetical protein
MSIINRISETIDRHYDAHPDAAAMRDKLDASGVQPSVLGDKHGSGQAVIDARQEERRRQVEQGSASIPGAALHASHIAVEQVTGEHQIPVEVHEHEAKAA